MRLWLTLGLAALQGTVWASMPPAEQNALVKKYCAVCHTDAAMNGGLSLEHYDAAKRDPALAAMILSKLNNGAMGAAGNGVPDKPAQEAWLEAANQQASGSKNWFVSREASVVSASMVREVAPRKGSPAVPIYRVRVACNPAKRVGEMQLTWSPQPQTGRTMSVSVDGSAPAAYEIQGTETMGNTGTGQSGHASAFLSKGKDGKLALPNRSLMVRELFPGETVEFSFSDMDPAVRAELRECFE